MRRFLFFLRCILCVEGRGGGGSWSGRQGFFWVGGLVLGEILWRGRRQGLKG